MSNSSRDTQFQGFAKLLFEQTMATSALDMVDAERFWGDTHIAELKLLLAQRAYDLALHVLQEVGSLHVNRVYSKEELLEYLKDKLTDVPDMTTWPERES